MKVFRLATGVAIGYVLGARAGRDKYEQIVAAARKAQDHPAVKQVQDKARSVLHSAGATPGTETAANGLDRGAEAAPLSTIASSSDPAAPAVKATAADTLSSLTPRRRQPTTAAVTLNEPLI